MGCINTKLKGKDFELHVGDDSYYKIQAVLKVESHKRKKRRHNSKSSSLNRNNTEFSKSTECSSRVRTTKTHRNNVPKNVYDARITAKYNIKALVGKGTYSKVLRVEHKVTKQPYALKMIEALGGRETFEAELSVLMRVNNPYVIRLIELFESNKKVYMVMELATGGNLLDRLESRGTLTEVNARSVMKMVLSGVQYLHGLGITHRDLKPDNLLYYHPGLDSKIMITDFGLASTRKPSGNPYMHTVCGTPQYIAPEIVAQKAYTCSVDMWAIGVITYIVLSGVFPFDAEHDAQIFKLILKGKVNMIDYIWLKISKECKSFILNLLRHDPSHRLTAEKAIGHPWFTSSSLTYANQQSSPSNQQQDQSHQSARSVGSSCSTKSISSLRSGHRRVQVRHLDELSTDPEAVALM